MVFLERHRASSRNRSSLALFLIATLGNAPTEHDPACDPGLEGEPGERDRALEDRGLVGPAGTREMFTSWIDEPDTTMADRAVENPAAFTVMR
jgi:hypothetical protein